ncbi:MAG: LamB/YcsF family protein [Synergistaceae bacterium]|nr:LamB/YcsF family protein [Synergistaceae bacterium]MBR0094709.1 LamB/YcsF family protein [Synergistaceae bacterium]
MSFKVDLNSDLGESFGAWKMGRDADVLTFVSSANVACGFHAGDPMVMKQTVKDAIAAGVAIGAHPSYPDLKGFGRRNMTCSPDELYSDTLYQIGALRAFCDAAGVKLQHVKPHGAMYNSAAKKPEEALALAQAVKDAGGGLILMGLAGSEFDKAAEKLGIPYAAEAFADRGYMNDGTLVPRKMEGAFVRDVEVAAQRVIRMVKEGVVEAIDGTVVKLRPQSICLHGDSPSAVEMARTLRQRLVEAGIEILPLCKII